MCMYLVACICVCMYVYVFTYVSTRDDGRVRETRQGITEKMWQGSVTYRFCSFRVQVLLAPRHEAKSRVPTRRPRQHV